MESELVDQQIARRSARIYLPLSFGVALLFLLVASTTRQLPAVAVIGGAVWVGLLSWIVSMPIVTSRVKARARTRAEDTG